MDFTNTLPRVHTDQIMQQIKKRNATEGFQSPKTSLLAIGLFVASACGTFALFGFVPWVASMQTHPSPQLTLSQLPGSVQPSRPVGRTHPSNFKGGSMSPNSSHTAR